MQLRLRTVLIPCLLAAGILLVAGSTEPGAAGGGDWAVSRLDSRLPDQPAVAMARDGRGVLGYVDGARVSVRTIGRSGRLGRARPVPGPPPSIPWAGVAVDGAGAVTVGWYVAGTHDQIALSTWRLGDEPPPGAIVSRPTARPGSSR